MVCAPSAAGQTYQGGVRGQVRDPQGVIPGAEVILVDQQTNATRTAVTNDVGEYAFANVLPATYTLKVSITGFKAEERKGLRVGTQQFIVEDFTLQVGAVEEQITVTGESPLIESSNPAVAASLDSKMLESLPIFGRNAFYLAISTPNVIQTGDPQFVRYQDQTNASFLSLGGGPRRGNGYLLEGVPITDFTNRPTIVPSIEAIEDLKIQVKTYDADMGHAAGGVFNTTAKSGSNTWHGSAVFVNKPEQFTGNLYFPKKTGAVKPSQVLLRLGRLAWRPDRQGQDLLLVHDGGLSAEEHAKRAAHAADGARTGREFFADRECRGRPGRHLRPAHDTDGSGHRRTRARSVPRKYHPARPDQSGGRGDDQDHAAPHRRQDIQRERRRWSMDRRISRRSRSTIAGTTN